MAKTIAELDTPCVLIDADRVEANLRRAQVHADTEGYALRPHIKTHKLPKFAKRQVELGAAGITVQKLGEAEVMADAGLADIFLPYNIIGPTKLARLKALNERVTLSVTADSPDTVMGYAKAFATGRPLTVLVECDTGGGRCGVQTPAQALALARQIGMTPGLSFGGLMTYPPRDFEKSDAWLAEAKAMLEQAGIKVPRITGGNTPNMWSTGRPLLTERRPGTYIYGDRMQVANGAATWDDCALTLLATVVSRPTATRVVLDAGSKTLSSDLISQDTGLGYGLLAGTEHVIASLSEEHGVIEMTAPSDSPRVGDRVRVIPNHACVVSNLHDRVHLVSGDTILETLPVAARGRVD